MDDGRRLAFRQSLHLGAICLRNSGNRVAYNKVLQMSDKDIRYTTESDTGDDTIFSIDGLWMNMNERPPSVA